MKLKKIYHPTNDGSNPVVSYMEVIHTGLSPEQNFSDRLVADGVANGWLTLNGTSLTIKAMPEDLRYQVKRTPGYYSKATGDEIPISALAMKNRFPVATLAAREANAWLKKNGQEEGAYVVTNAYECVLDPAQHERFHGVQDAAGNPVAADTLEGL